MNRSPRKIKKVLIIGIDGVPYSLLDHYIRNDATPNLKKILNQGFKLHQMNASIPDVSSVSWTSFTTGVNPGEHGIYGFTDLQPNSYSLFFPNSKDIKAPTFWEMLGKTGSKTSTLSQKYLKNLDQPYRSIVLNVPHTYPAYPMNGVLVSGFVAIDLKKATYPESAYTTLHSMNYLIDVEAEKAKEDKKGFMKSLFDCFEVRKKAISHFFKNEPWDLFFACITETDRLNHFFFDASRDSSHPFYKDFFNFYSEVDKFIGVLYEGYLEKYQGEGGFLILSDHGFATLKKEVYINPFLAKEGFLTLKNEGSFFERIDPRTKAFNMDPCRIYLHERDSFPRGTVNENERMDLLKEIKDTLLSLKGENGESVIDQIYMKREIYKGPHCNRAPDLVCLPKDGYDLKGSLEKKEIFGQSLFAGMHTRHDAFCVLPEQVTLSVKPSIEELADTILQNFTQ